MLGTPIYGTAEPVPFVQRRSFIQFFGCCPEAAVGTKCAVAAKSHLSPLLRCAWDSGHLPTLDMHHHLQATGTHISLIAHMGEWVSRRAFLSLRMVCPDSQSLNDLYRDIGSARQELEGCRRPGLHWYVPGLMEW
jgi:hypothetical protein